MARSAAGWAARYAAKAAWPMTRLSMVVAAIPVAVRGLSSMAAISPIRSPRPRIASRTERPSRLLLTTLT